MVVAGCMGLTPLWSPKTAAIVVGVAAGLTSGISKLRIRKSYVLRKQSELVLWLPRLLRIRMKGELIALVPLKLRELTLFGAYGT
ncbi:hypothetical protein PIB30_080910 [Stylosanthes scabra]|uniref:Uncharacterized protein n=1 Tax=Stylosanthes scabra TaxID=79078 RepID=A0ABU6YQE4_9FABA|nr:hypothetical protein [Stylosanthes scabra]